MQRKRVRTHQGPETGRQLDYRQKHVRTLPRPREGIEVRYRYRLASTPRCGLGKGVIELDAVDQGDADAKILRIERRFYEGHARQNECSYTWSVYDGDRLVASGVTTPTGTVMDARVAGCGR